MIVVAVFPEIHPRRAKGKSALGDGYGEVHGGEGGGAACRRGPHNHAQTGRRRGRRAP